jgi:hypothetical protein
VKDPHADSAPHRPGRSPPPAWSLRALGRDDLPVHFDLNGLRYRMERTIKHDFWAATGFYTDAAGHRVVLKVGRTIEFAAIPFRPVGRWLCRREMGFFERLADVPGVPRLLGRVSDTGFVHDYVPGRPLCEFHALGATFFDDLSRLMGDVHSRGIAYIDSNKSSNILVGDDGRPHLIDFQISAHDRAFGGPPWRYLIRRLQAIDTYHIAKHKRRLCPDALTAADREILKRRTWIVRAHRAITAPYFRFRRAMFSRLKRSGKLLPTGSE